MNISSLLVAGQQILKHVKFLDSGRHWRLDSFCFPSYSRMWCLVSRIMKSQFWILSFCFNEKTLQNVPICPISRDSENLGDLTIWFCTILARHWPCFTAVLWLAFVFLDFVLLGFLEKQMFYFALPYFFAFSVMPWPNLMLLYIKTPLKIISLTNNSSRKPAFTST